jgi:hypothetical protein
MADETSKAASSQSAQDNLRTLEICYRTPAKHYGVRPNPPEQL